MHAWLQSTDKISNEPIFWYIEPLKQIYVVMDLWITTNKPMNRPHNLFWGYECS